MFVSEEYSKCKNILNDQKIYDWIQNVRFITLLTDDVSGPEQTTKLETPEPVFGRAMGSKIAIDHDPDAGSIDKSPRLANKLNGMACDNGKSRMTAVNRESCL